MKASARRLLLILSSLALLVCVSGQTTVEERLTTTKPTTIPRPSLSAVDPLPSWNDGAVKRSLLQFVSDVTNPSGQKFVPPSERIATFDNDGTLCVERPVYFPVLFLVKRVQDLAALHPEWMANPVLKSVIENDPETIGRLHTWDLMTMAFAAHTGITEEEYEILVSDFLGSTRHPRFGKPLAKLVYQPMLELVRLLKDNGFKVYICSGGGAGFVRAFSEPAYKIPREQVIGTAVQSEFQLRDGRPAFLRLPALVEPICEKAGKPVNIYRQVGRQPILAFGNSDGDIQMLEFTEGSRRPFLVLLLRHDDAEREYAYDARSEQALSLAKARPWTVVSMKNDFKVMFPF